MLYWTRLAAMWTQNECVQTLIGPEMIQNAQIREHVVQVVCIIRILVLVPLFRCRSVFVDEWILLWLTFIVHRIEADHVLKELVQFGMCARFGGHFQQRQKYIIDHLLEIIQYFVQFENITGNKYVLVL